MCVYKQERARGGERESKKKKIHEKKNVDSRVPFLRLPPAAMHADVLCARVYVYDLAPVNIDCSRKEEQVQYALYHITEERIFFKKKETNSHHAIAFCLFSLFCPVRL